MLYPVSACTPALTEVRFAASISEPHGRRLTVEVEQKAMSSLIRSGNLQGTSSEGYQTRINRALREYVQGQATRSRRSRV